MSCPCAKKFPNRPCFFDDNDASEQFGTDIGYILPAGRTVLRRGTWSESGLVPGRRHPAWPTATRQCIGVITMGKCINHPERETQYLCMKHQVFLCEDCLSCRDPKLYCKSRSACPINFIEKDRKKHDGEQQQPAEGQQEKAVQEPACLEAADR